MALGYNPAPRGVVKNGKFYHVYYYGTPQERWEYVREASGTGGAAAAPGGGPPPPLANGLAGPTIPQMPAPPTPFLTADDLMSQNNFWTQWNTTFSDLDTALAKLKSDTGYQQKQLDTGRVENKDANDWNAGARGISQSSIKDGATAKIEADYTRGTNQLKDNLRISENDVAKRKNDFNTITLPAQQAAWNAKATENARAASYNAPPPADGGGAPAPAAAPAAAPTAASAGYRNVVKNGKFYHVYGYGTPQEKWTYIRQAA